MPRWHARHRAPRIVPAKPGRRHVRRYGNAWKGERLKPATVADARIVQDRRHSFVMNRCRCPLTRLQTSFALQPFGEASFGWRTDRGSYFPTAKPRKLRPPGPRPAQRFLTRSACQGKWSQRGAAVPQVCGVKELRANPRPRSQHWCPLGKTSCCETPRSFALYRSSGGFTCWGSDP